MPISAVPPGDGDSERVDRVPGLKLYCSRELGS